MRQVREMWGEIVGTEWRETRMNKAQQVTETEGSG